MMRFEQTGLRHVSQSPEDRPLGLEIFGIRYYKSARKYLCKLHVTDLRKFVRKSRWEILPCPKTQEKIEKLCMVKVKDMDPLDIKIDELLQLETSSIWGLVQSRSEAWI